MNRRSHGTSDSSCCGTPNRPGKAAPTVSTSRPPDSRSMDASVWAACTGRRSTGSNAAVPSVTVLVTGAAAASMVRASMRGVSKKSFTQSEE